MILATRVAEPVRALSRPARTLGAAPALLRGMPMPNDLIVLAIGGNSLIRDEQHRTVQDQWVLARETCHHIAQIVEAGHRVVVTHGNGPQVGFIVRRSELARHELHEVPLDSCDADTQGAIGYMIQQSLENEFTRRGTARGWPSRSSRRWRWRPHDPAFTHPVQAHRVVHGRSHRARARAAQERWTIAEDAGRGWRRVVPSPDPVRIVELEAIRTLVDAGFVVTAVGGGGIPVVRDERGELHGVEAVIDKDLASALLATALGADQFVISTGVDRVYLDYRNADAARRSIASRVDEAAALPRRGPVRRRAAWRRRSASLIRYLEAGGTRASSPARHVGTGCRRRAGHLGSRPSPARLEWCFDALRRARPSLARARAGVHR